MGLAHKMGPAFHLFVKILISPMNTWFERTDKEGKELLDYPSFTDSKTKGDYTQQGSTPICTSNGSGGKMSIIFGCTKQQS